MSATDRAFNDTAQAEARALRQDERREKRTLLSLCSPSLLLVALILLLPMGWLFGLSVLDGDGRLTDEHYRRIWSEGAYISIFMTTFQVSVMVTGICIIIGYPLSYFLALLPQKWANILLLGVLIPFWTSLLVRTYAWLILLQRRGLVNSTLMDLGLIDQPLRLVHNMTGTVIGMVHVMLPFLVLPLYASMRAIDPTLSRASANLGASPTRTFFQVFLPLSVPGLIAGSVLVFIMCLGFYITPAILGGGRVQMIAQRIEASVSLFPTWGAASALGVVLLVLTTGFLIASHLLVKRLQKRTGF